MNKWFAHFQEPHAISCGERWWLMCKNTTLERKEVPYLRTMLKSLMMGTELGSSRNLGGAAENLIGDREKRICRLSF